MEYAENLKKEAECLYKSLHDTQHRSEPLSWNSLRIRLDRLHADIDPCHISTHICMHLASPQFILMDLPRAGHVGTAVNYISPERPNT